MISKRFRFRKLGEKEIAVLGGDFDSHVGINSKNYEDQHSGYGYGVRNKGKGFLNEHDSREYNLQDEGKSPGHI